MPNVESARKRVRTNEKRRLHNRVAKASLRTSLKRVATVAEAKDADALKRAAGEALSVIGKTRQKGVINRRRAARLQSRVQRTLNKALAAPASAAPAPEAAPTNP